MSEGGHLIAGKLNINPNNSPQNEFVLTLPDGSAIARDDLIQSYAGYAGPATRIHIKPKGSGKQGGLVVDGAPYELDNSNAYDIISGAMTVRLYNDRVDKKGRAMGQWWIELAATNATITVDSNSDTPTPPYSVTKFYTWGLDLSGSLQGAGGIGGLLCVLEGRDGSPSRPFFPCADGNGNISDYVDTNGVVVAHREYDPFGQTTAYWTSLSASGGFNFWFSTKYYEPLWGLYYYGYRFYSPNLHIWLSRDPIGERGGKNLFVFVKNDPIDRFDKLGLMGCSPCRNGTPHITTDLTGAFVGGTPDLYCQCTWHYFRVTPRDPKPPCEDSYEDLGTQHAYYYEGSAEVGGPLERGDQNANCKRTCINVTPPPPP